MPKTIGIFHYKVGGTDGVSLEIEKWKRVLEDMGHTVHLCAGHLGSTEGTLIPEMYHHLPEIERLTSNTFSRLVDFDAVSYKEDLGAWTYLLERRICDFITDKKIDFIIPQNVWSVGLNPPAAIALERVRQQFHLPALAQSHDFYFERPDISLTCSAAVELADKYLPPRDPLIQHVVINSLAQKELLARKEIQASIVPNVFDFDAPPWKIDDYNEDFRQCIGLNPNDILILQATRIVTRKAIELAIDFVEALNKPGRRAHLKTSGLYDGRQFSEENRIVLLLAGYAGDDATGLYKDLLVRKAKSSGVEALFIEDLVSEQRETRSGKKIYSLWDTYVFADFVTYPSLWEGWGNQLLEALRAKLPVLLFEYPVYTADIQEKGLHVVSLGNQISGRDPQGLATIDPSIIESAADQAVELLTNADRRRETVDHNFRIGQMYYSMDALREHLERLMGN